jgi:hypothetical protein
VSGPAGPDWDVTLKIARKHKLPKLPKLPKIAEIEPIKALPLIKTDRADQRNFTAKGKMDAKLERLGFCNLITFAPVASIAVCSSSDLREAVLLL